MAAVDPLARPLLSAMFIFGGLDALRHPEGKIETAKAITVRLEGKGPVPDDTAQLIRINGATQVVAGLLLGFGVLPRLCALTLFGSLLPTTLAGHRFWEKSGDERSAQQIQFLKNLAMAGGLLAIAGRPRQ